MSVTSLSTKTIKLPTGEQTARLPTITHCYLLTHCLKDGPVAVVIMANVVANGGKSHERGNCPAYGKTCNRCQGINHFKAVCRSKVAAKTGQSPHRSKKSQPPRRGSTGSYNGQGKQGGKKKKTPKKPPKQNAYAVTMKNSVPSEVTTTSGGEREKQGNVSSKTVPSGPEEEGTYNRFSCFAVHSKMSQSTNAKSKPTEGLHTDTDPDNRSEIITDVTIRMPGKAGTMMMEVKVDPGAKPSCIPLHKFKTLFPHLCRDGLPKEGLLDNTHNEFPILQWWRHDMLWAPANRCQRQGHQEVSSH